MRVIFLINFETTTNEQMKKKRTKFGSYCLFSAKLFLHFLHFFSLSLSFSFSIFLAIYLNILSSHYDCQFGTNRILNPLNPKLSPQQNRISKLSPYIYQLNEKLIHTPHAPTRTNTPTKRSQLSLMCRVDDQTHLHTLQRIIMVRILCF